MLGLLLGVPALTHGQVKDIDGNCYKTVKIGKQEWLAENLNVSHFRNGDLIPEAKTKKEWENAGEEGKPVWCYYNNALKNGQKYSKLYNYYVVNDPRGLAPAGWHVPSDAEWTQLTDYLGGEDVAGSKMRSKNGRLKNGNGKDIIGFSGLPSGDRDHYGEFYDIGSHSYWWSTSLWENRIVWGRGLKYDIDKIARVGFDIDGGRSVRCIKD